jgi:hypothetical protein
LLLAERVQIEPPSIDFHQSRLSFSRDWFCEGGYASDQAVNVFSQVAAHRIEVFGDLSDVISQESQGGNNRKPTEFVQLLPAGGRPVLSFDLMP